MVVVRGREQGGQRVRGGEGGWLRPSGDVCGLGVTQASELRREACYWKDKER